MLIISVFPRCKMGIFSNILLCKNGTVTIVNTFPRCKNGPLCFLFVEEDALDDDDEQVAAQLFGDDDDDKEASKPNGEVREVRAQCTLIASFRV